MISVDNALALLVENVPPPRTERIALADSPGRLLAENIPADRDGPPFDRVMMDGYAISSAEYDDSRRVFKVSDFQGAGSPRRLKSGAGTAMEVATGAPLPEGCDTVIPYEACGPGPGEGEISILRNYALKQWQNVHRRGSDYRSGDIVLKAQTVISSPLVHSLASLGKEYVTVRSRARFACLSSGDELVSVSSVPSDYQIRQSNIEAISAEASAWGLKPGTRLHSGDDYVPLKAAFESLVADNDVVIVSGGVSKGKRDLVPEVLRDLGMEIIFHEVAQKPGKPLLFGRLPGGRFVFGLPGNPVSSLVTFRRYVLTFLLAWEGQEETPVRLSVGEATGRRPGQTLFLPVDFDARSGAARATGKGNSGDFAGIADSTGFVQLPPESLEGLYFPWGLRGNVRGSVLPTGPHPMSENSESK